MNGKGSSLRRWSVAVTAVLALALGALSFAQNRTIVRDLPWPGFDVQYRELASAQTLLDQGYGPDAEYTNEHVWYNPMTAWVIAGASRLSGISVPAVVNRLGPSVNLAAPAALFLVAVLVFDGATAVAVTAAFVFLVGTEFPFYDSATYTPWFAPESFGQAFLYLLLAAVYRAFRPRASLLWSVLCGLLLGLTFLTHTAPALLGGGVIVAVGAWDMWAGGDRRENLARVGVALLVALVVSLPFAFEILFLYHLRIVNQFPSQSPNSLLDLNELPSLVRDIAAPAIVAAVALWLRASKNIDDGLRVLLAWTGIILALLGLNAVRLLLGKAGLHVPPVVPAFHFFSYLMTMVAVGIGVAIRDLSTAVLKRLRWGSGKPESEVALAGGLVACAVTLLLVIVAYPRYLRRDDFTEVRDDAVAMNARFPIDVVEWIRAHTSPRDVFLCTDDASMYIVAPAGRKVVSTNRYFSNPYVDWESRDRDRARMYGQLERGDLTGFLALAAKYRVRFVLVTRDRSTIWLHAAGLAPVDLPTLEPASLGELPVFERVFENGRFAILAVRPPAARLDARVEGTRPGGASR